jgi:hypothetical protein
MPNNPHFQNVSSWQAAREMLTFRPLEPNDTAGHCLQSISIYIRDYQQRELAVGERTLEAHYGAFVLSQARKGEKEAKRLVIAVSYGRAGWDVQIAGCAARVYELGPEPPPDDIDGRSPSVVAWYDDEMFYLIASDKMLVNDLVRIARSLYD